ncbi:M56 family metallopeptidase [Streptomyces sp. NPDC047014]|uniref:M56 family metallopeptidase n=1 Tax=Streptomyces sp. NPDC047014 TaxID=3155736 RepID=UPI0033D1776A
MLLLVFATLAFPWVGAAVAGRVARALPPRWACWALTASALLLAGGTLSALIGLFHVPFLASLENLPLSRTVREWPAVLPLAGAAGALLLLQSVLLARRWLRHRRVLKLAWLSAQEGVGDGDVLVVPGAEADAYALPGHRGRPGKVVITSGMIRSLKPEEREVLLAHERAHLAGRHHLLSAAVDLTATVHPAITRLRRALAFHLERWADEEAARAVGDRRTAAAAVARAALAGSARGEGRGFPLLSATSGPVPLRVRALLGPAPAGPHGGARRAGLTGLAGSVLLAAVLALVMAYGLHEYVEYSARQLLGVPASCSDLWGTFDDVLGVGGR